MIIVLANRKGGVSKTTSTAYLATCLQQRGHKVSCLDGDEDASLVKWHGTGLLPFEVRPMEHDLEKQLPSLKAEFILIDTPPNDKDIMTKAVMLADEVIVPIAATALDVSRLFTTLRTIAEVEKLRDKALSSVLLTKFQPNLAISQAVLDELEKANVPLLDSKIRNLTRYQAFTMPTYLDEYEAVLIELGVIKDAQG